MDEDCTNNQGAIYKIDQTFLNVSSALKFISSSNFKTGICVNTKIILLKLHVSEILDTKLNELSFTQHFDSNYSILLEFTATTDEKKTKIFWKLKNNDNFHTIEEFADPKGILSEFNENFLLKAIEIGNDGILESSQSKDRLEINDLGNGDNCNLLMLAAESYNSEVVDILLEYNFNVDAKDLKRKTAIDKAWLIYLNTNDKKIKFESNRIILALLNANSMNPGLDFKYEDASKEVREFIEYCLSLHKDINQNYFEELKRKLKTKPHLCHFYNEENKSLMRVALESRNIEICKFLINQGISIGSHETDYLGELYKGLDGNDLKELSDQHMMSGKEIVNSHIYVLKMKCKIANHDRQYQSNFKYIEQALEVIDTNETCSKVLKVASACKRVFLIFDFKRDTTYYLDPRGSNGSRARVNSSGEIYIGALLLLNENSKYIIYGAIIHELCHIAALMTYINNFDPYPVGDSEEKVRYGQVFQECKNNKNAEPIVCDVYECYIETLQHSELIVRVPQMIMHYFKNDGELARCVREFPGIFGYFKDIFEPELERSFVILKKLQDNDAIVKFDEIIEPMKLAIMSKQCNFQGVGITLSEVIDQKNSIEILENLESEKIKNCLFKGAKIPIGDASKVAMDCKIIPRRFTNRHNRIGMNNSMTFDEVQSLTEESRVFILADTAGAGKTTILEDMAIKLKKVYKNFWVSFIKLRDHRTEFSDLKQRMNLDVKIICDMLIRIFGIKTLFEVKIFRKLFKCNRVILLFDGIDEISPDFNFFIMNILHILKEHTQNQIWISTRPQHAVELEEKLEVKAFKLVPYTWNEKKELIHEILQKCGITEEIEQQAAIQDFEKFFHEIENRSFFSSEINNPLMIKNITELYVDNAIDIKSDSLDIFMIFEKMTEKHKREVIGKIPFEHKDPFRNFSINQIHQVLAMKFLFGEKFGKILKFSGTQKESPKFNPDTLPIMKKWRNIKLKVTGQEIQRFGFVTIDHDFLKTVNSAVDFIHTTYAEFFVAQLILSMIFDADDDYKDEVYRNMFEFLKVIAYEHNSSIILNFLWCYVRSNKEDLTMQENIKKLLRNEVKKFELNGENYNRTIQSIKFFSVFLIGELEVLKSTIWKSNDAKSLLEKIFENEDFSSVKLKELFETLEISFGGNWHEEFNKSDMKLINDEEIKKSDIDPKLNCNFLKLLDLSKTFDNLTQKNIYRRCFLNNSTVISDLSRSTSAIVISTGIQLFKDCNYDLIKLFVNFIKQTQNEMVLVELGEHIMQLDKPNIENILFYKYSIDEHLLNKTVCLKNVEAFQIFKCLYQKFHTPGKFNGFGNDLLSILLKISPENFEEFSNLIKLLFKSNSEVVSNCFDNYNFELASLLSNDGKLNSLKEFSMNLFNNDMPKVDSFIRTVLSNNISYAYTQAIKAHDIKKIQVVTDICTIYKVSLIENKEQLVKIIVAIFCNMNDQNLHIFENFLMKNMKLNEEDLCSHLIADEVNVDVLTNMKTLKYIEKIISENFGGSVVRNVLRNILFYKYSTNFIHPIQKLIECGRLKEVNEIMKLCQQYQNIAHKFDEVFKLQQIINSFLLHLAVNEYSDSMNFLNEVFKSKKEELLNFLEEDILGEVIASKTCCQIFEKVLIEFFENDENLVRISFKKILLHSYKDSDLHPFLKIMAKNDPKEVERYRMLNIKYKTEWNEIKDQLLPNEHACEIIKLISDGVTYVLEEVMDSNDKYDDHEQKHNIKMNDFDFIGMILEELALHDSSCQTKSNTRLNFSKFINFMERVKKHLKDTDMDRIKMALLEYKNSISYQLLLFLNESFKSEKHLITEILDTYNVTKLLLDVKNLSHLEMIMNHLSQSDESFLAQFIRTNLHQGWYYQNLLILAGDDIHKIQRLTDIYARYRGSWKEVQNFFISSKNIFSTCKFLTRDTFPIFLEFLKTVFESDPDRLIECLYDFSGFTVDENVENFHTLYNFVIGFVNTERAEEFFRGTFNSNSGNAQLRDILNRFDPNLFQNIERVVNVVTESYSDIQNVFSFIKNVWDAIDSD